MRAPASKSVENPIIAQEIASRVIERLREEDAVIGHVTDHHVKWLLMFTYQMFDVRLADMVFDFHSTPKKIYIAPVQKHKDILKPIDKSKWHKYRIMLKSKSIEERLPAHLGIPEVQVKFCRVAPKGDRTLKPPPVGEAQ